MLWGFILLIVAIAILRSVQLLWSSYSDSTRFFSLYNLATLFLIYTTVLIAFGLSYVVLEEMGFAVLKEEGESLNAHSFNSLKFVYILAQLLYCLLDMVIYLRLELGGGLQLEKR